jgi:hypothetical protein
MKEQPEFANRNASVPHSHLPEPVPSDLASLPACQEINELETLLRAGSEDLPQETESPSLESRLNREANSRTWGHSKKVVKRRFRTRLRKLIVRRRAIVRRLNEIEAILAELGQRKTSPRDSP